MRPGVQVSMMRIFGYQFTSISANTNTALYLLTNQTFVSYSAMNVPQRRHQLKFVLPLAEESTTGSGKTSGELLNTKSELR